MYRPNQYLRFPSPFPGLHSSAAVSAGVFALTTVISLSLGYENSMLNALDCEDADYYAPNFFNQLWGVAFVIIWNALCFHRGLQ